MSHPEQAPADREIEQRVYEIDSDSLRSTLKDLGAVSLGISLMERAVLDVRPVHPDRWIRVRTEEGKTTMAIKEHISQEVDGTGEVELEVASFDDALKFLKSLNGYEPRSIQESRRDAYELDGVEVTIDTWPLIPDFMEIEAKGENAAEALYETADRLGIDRALLTGKPVEQYYLETLGIDIKTTPLRFK